MTLFDGFHQNVVYESLRLWTFPPQREPSWLEFRAVGGGALVGCKMKTLGSRSEVGVLEMKPAPRTIPPEAVIRVLARRFRVTRWDTYSSPVDMSTSAARFVLDKGDLMVAANAFPCHIAVRFGASVHGSPEFDWSDYHRNHV